MRCRFAQHGAKAKFFVERPRYRDVLHRETHGKRAQWHFRSRRRRVLWRSVRERRQQ